MTCFQRLLSIASTQFTGFRKRGNYLYVEREGNWGFIDFLQDKRPNSDPNSTKFTVDFSIVSQKLLNRFNNVYTYSKNPSKNPGPKQNHLDQRLGYLLAYQTDYWWEINPILEDSVTVEVLSGIENHGIPFIDENISDASLCSRWFKFFKAGRSLNANTWCFLVYLLKEEGREEDFQQVAERVAREHGHRPFEISKGSTVLDFLAELGLPRLPTFK